MTGHDHDMTVNVGVVTSRAEQCTETNGTMQ